MIDLHCHQLPGIDDGPEDQAAALALARAQVAAGIDTVVCTPHVSHSYPRTTSTVIAERVAALQDVLAAEQIPLRLLTGGEVALARALELEDDELASLRLGRSPWLLLEAPLATDVPRLGSLIRGLQSRGHKLLLAHPERCMAFHQHPALLGELVEGGARAQITARSLTGDYGRTVEKLARGMVNDGLVHVIASDAHNDARRPPGLAGPLEEAGLGYLTPWATREVPQAMLDGADLPPAPAGKPKRRGLFSRR